MKQPTHGSKNTEEPIVEIAGGPRMRNGKMTRYTVEYWRNATYSLLKEYMDDFIDGFMVYLERSNYTVSTRKQYRATMVTALRYGDIRDSEVFEVHLNIYQKNTQYMKKSAYKVFRMWLYGETGGSTDEKEFEKFIEAGNIKVNVRDTARFNHYRRCADGFRRMGVEVIRGIELGYISEDFKLIMAQMLRMAKYASENNRPAMRDPQVTLLLDNLAPERNTKNPETELKVNNITLDEHNMFVDAINKDVGRMQIEVKPRPDISLRQMNEDITAASEFDELLTEHKQKLEEPVQEETVENMIKFLVESTGLPAESLATVASENPEEIKQMYSLFKPKS